MDIMLMYLLNNLLLDEEALLHQLNILIMIKHMHLHGGFQAVSTVCVCLCGKLASCIWRLLCA